MDVVIYAGPVVIKKAFEQIEWDRPTKIVPVQGAGSSNFVNLAFQLKRDGRILPELLRRYVKMDRDQIGKLAMASYSAGWGLMNQMFQIDADREEIDAYVASDSAFGGPLRGHEMFAADAIDNQRLMVVTSTNNSANWAQGILKTARDTVTEMMDNAHELSGAVRDYHQVSVRDPLTQPSGGVWKLGKFYWLDYVEPGAPDNQGNDYTHGEHHDLAAPVWQAYLAPYFGGRLGFPWLTAAAVAALLGGGGYAAYRYAQRA